ncbi:MAG: pilus assembly protein PilP, partial [Methylococcales bacterium]|nr:pilus assembly protein PilP [Methylococcales bacterium]
EPEPEPEPEPKSEEKKSEEKIEVEEDVMVEINPVKRIPNGIKPDFERVKEDLESFPLESLSMVGSVKIGGIWGLVRFSGGVQKVRVGNYIGQNHGLILEITDISIKIEEIIEEEKDYWVKKKTELSLRIGSDE